MKHLLKLLLALLVVVPSVSSAQYVVGSKAFTESYILGEAAKDLLTGAGLKDVSHKQGMGKTIILWQALTGNSIQVYPEYTGTIAKEILKLDGSWDLLRLSAELQKQGIGMSKPLGFNNTYALVMTKKRAAELHITKMSDLKGHEDLACGPTLEFLGRKDGWKPMLAAYGLNMTNVKGIEHKLGYTAMLSGSIDLKDAYSTDADIADNNLVVLKDDLNFFPAYQAVYLYRLSLPKAGVDALNSVDGKIDETAMTKFNAEAEKSKNYASAANDLLNSIKVKGGNAAGVAETSVWSDMLGYTIQHLKLVSISMLIAIIVGLPLGVAAAKRGPLSATILSIVGLIQTIPSLALFAILVPWLGTEPKTAILALFLYSLLPIVRNTATGLQSIAPSLKESAEALGLEPMARLWKVELPLAGPTILAGIKTSAIINVGTAAIAAFIGAGGLGQPIQTGLSLSDNSLIVRGAVAAAVLALLVQFAFDAIEYFVIPRGLRLERQSA